MTWRRFSLTSQPYMAQAKTEYDAAAQISRTTRPQRDTAAAMGLNGRNGPGFAGPFGDIGPGQSLMGQILLCWAEINAPTIPLRED